MPELPEVETVCRTIAPHIVGRRIVSVHVRCRRLRRLVPADFAKNINGKKALRVWRRAKYALIELQNNVTVIVHLGMSGVLQITRRPPSQKHEHIGVGFDDGAFLLYRDPRRFGLITLCKTAIEKHPLLKNLGVEPFAKEYTADYLHGIFQNRRVAIKTALMDGKAVAGVGNIYAAEILFAAKINPAAAANSIGKKRLQKIVDATRRILQNAIDDGGSSMRDFVDGDGAAGYFQTRWRVYGRGGEPCECGKTIRRVVQGGRATFYCPRCQKR